MGTRNVGEKQPKMIPHIIELFHLRAANGSAVGTCTPNWKDMHPKMYHYSKEYIYSPPLSSYITPKGSPLQVDLRTVLL